MLAITVIPVVMRMSTAQVRAIMAGTALATAIGAMRTLAGTSMSMGLMATPTTGIGMLWGR